MYKNKPLQILKALWADFTAKRVMRSASLLTYSTLLAIVPVVAVIFAIARGFGYNKYIETWFRSTLDSQPQAVEVIIGFVNSYLVHTKSGIVFGFGLLFMLWTIIMLTRNIELTFNDIWNVHKQRSLLRTFTDYLAMFFILPIMIIVISGVILWMTSIAKMVNETYVIGPLLKLGIDALPSVILTGIITILYVFMPNTRVKWKSAIFPALGAALCMQLLQYFYVNSQIWVSSYNAIYGSFAALPLFMLWMQFSWTIILIGAELSYTKQNLEHFTTNSSIRRLSHRHKLLLCALIMSKICKRFKNGEKHYTQLELKQETGLPIGIVADIIYELQKAKLITESGGGAKEEYKEYLPSESIENITIGMLISRLESTKPWQLDLDLHTLLSSPKWKRTLTMRHNYLRAQKDIKLYEL